MHKSGELNGSFWGISVRKAQNRLRYSDLVAVKARDFFGETSPRNEESLVPIVFIGTNMLLRGEPSAAQKFGG